MKWLAAVLVVSVACTHQPPRTAPNATQEWLVALASAKSDAADGNYEMADSILRSYVQRYDGTAEARESAYWRAVLALDPGNHGGNTRAAIAQLDTYLADSLNTAHRVEAIVLRRVATAMDSLSQVRVAAIATTPTEADHGADSARSAEHERELQGEIQKLKEQLDNANAELDRIKKRLSKPKP